MSSTSTDLLKEDCTPDLGLVDLVKALWEGRWIIIIVSALFAVASVALALSITNMYRSSAILAPSSVNEPAGMASIASRFGGLASLAGINLGDMGSDRTAIAIETLQSQMFLIEFVKKHDLDPLLHAVEGWNASDNTILYDASTYDPNSKIWDWDTRSSWFKAEKPTGQDSYHALIERLSVKQDQDTGLVSISVKHESPFIAKQWVSWLIEDINMHMRNKDIEDSQKSIKYLKEKLQETSVAEMQKIFYELIEAQTKTMMLAEVRDEYVLRIIDPPVVPEMKSYPKRSLICVLGVLLGGVVGCMVVLARYVYRMGFK